MFKAFIFDMDGTLLDSEILWVEAVETFVRERDSGVSHAEVMSMVYGRSWRDVYDDIRRRLPNETMGFPEMTVVVRQYRRRLQGETDIRIGGSIELLKTLAENHAVCIVSGSGRAEVAAGIALMGVERHIRFYLAAEDYSPGKPAPVCYLLAAKRLGVEPRECAVFEDSEVGVLAAKAAGMFCVALARPSRPVQNTSGADLVLADLSSFHAAVSGGPPGAPRDPSKRGRDGGSEGRHETD